MLVLLKGFLRNSGQRRMAAVMKIPRKLAEVVFMRLTRYDLLLRDNMVFFLRLATPTRTPIDSFLLIHG